VRRWAFSEGNCRFVAKPSPTPEKTANSGLQLDPEKFLQGDELLFLGCSCKPERFLRALELVINFIPLFALR